MKIDYAINQDQLQSVKVMNISDRHHLIIISERDRWIETQHIYIR